MNLDPEVLVTALPWAAFTGLMWFEYWSIPTPAEEFHPPPLIVQVAFGTMHDRVVRLTMFALFQVLAAWLLGWSPLFVGEGVAPASASRNSQWLIMWTLMVAGVVNLVARARWTPQAKEFKPDGSRRWWAGQNLHLLSAVMNFGSGMLMVLTLSVDG